MKDKLIYSSIAQLEDSCYEIPLNEKHYSYKCLVSGYQSSTLWKDGEFDIEELESTLPELYKDLKIIDENGLHWYPQVIVDPVLGTLFANGADKDNWGWSIIKNIPVPEDEKERFKNPSTGEYLTHKSDPKSMKNFDKFGFIDALGELGLLE